MSYDQVLALIPRWSYYSTGSGWSCIDQLKPLLTDRGFLLKVISLNPEVLIYLDQCPDNLLEDDQALLQALQPVPERLLFLLVRADQYTERPLKSLLRRSLLLPCLRSALATLHLPNPMVLGELFELLPSKLSSDRELLLVFLQLELKYGIFNWLGREPSLRDYPQYRHDWELLIYFLAHDGQDLLLVDPKRWSKQQLKGLVKLAVLNYPNILLQDGWRHWTSEWGVIKLAIAAAEYWAGDVYRGYDYYQQVTEQFHQQFRLTAKQSGRSFTSNLNTFGVPGATYSSNLANISPLDRQEKDQLTREIVGQLTADKSRYFSIGRHCWVGLWDVTFNFSC